jgi:predicted DNA-binding protein with PD1-like motif
VQLFSVAPGEEVMESLGRQLAASGIRDGAVVSLVGAVEGCAISNMLADDASKDIVTEYDQPLELTGTGEVKDGNLHLHVTLGREGDVALAGHLHRAHVVTFFVNAYVIALRRETSAAD